MYRCSLAGKCELDDEGFLTQEECRRGCVATDLPLDVVYDALSFSPEDALSLAPSDRVEVIHRLTGARVQPVRSRDVLRALLDESPDAIAHYPELYPWAERNLYPSDWVAALADAGSRQAVAELRRLGYEPMQETLDLVRD